MPLNAKGRKILAQMKKTYRVPGQAEEIFHKSRRAGRIRGVEKRGR